MAKKTAKYVVSKAAIFTGPPEGPSVRHEIGETVELTKKEAKHFLRLLAPWIDETADDDEETETAGGAEDDAAAGAGAAELVDAAVPEPEAAPEPAPTPSPATSGRRRRSRANA